jgi:hypothetical protein
MSTSAIWVVSGLNPFFATRAGVGCIVLGVVVVVAGLSRARRQARGPAVTAPSAANHSRPMTPSPGAAAGTSWDNAATDFFGASSAARVQAPTVAATGSPPPTWQVTHAASPPTRPPAGRRSSHFPTSTLLGGLALVAAGVLLVLPTVLDTLEVRHVGLAEQVGPLTLTTPTGDLATMKQRAEQQLQSIGPSIRNVQVGIYTQGVSTRPSAIVMAAEVVGDPLRENVFEGMQSGAASRGTAVVLTGVDAGRLGGDLRCGRITTNAGSVPMCAWVDSDTVGMVILTPLADVGDTTDFARTMREATET